MNDTEYDRAYGCTVVVDAVGRLCHASPARALWPEGDYGASGMAGQAVCAEHDGHYTVVTEDGTTTLRGAPMRYALIRTQNARAVRQYLPRNYSVISVASDGVLIGGHDDAGWTLDDYVLPRLASGLYFGEEVQRVAQGERYHDPRIDRSDPVQAAAEDRYLDSQD